MPLLFALPHQNREEYPTCCKLPNLRLEEWLLWCMPDRIWLRFFRRETTFPPMVPRYWQRVAKVANIFITHGDCYEWKYWLLSKYGGDDGMASGWSLKVGNFHSTSEAVTLDGPGHNHYVWYGWMCHDDSYMAMPLGILLAKKWWIYSCFSPFLRVLFCHCF